METGSNEEGHTGEPHQHKEVDSKVEGGGARPEDTGLGAGTVT